MTTIAHVVDQYSRYPGELITFYTRLEISKAVSGQFVLMITLPDGLELLPQPYQLPEFHADTVPRFERHELGTRLIWKYNGDLAVGFYDYQYVAKVFPTHQDKQIESEARAICRSEETTLFDLSEVVSLEILAKAKTIRYLPAIYHDDYVLARFLMFFESFWKPIENHIGNISYYFDPKLTPPDFLPWLSSWLDLAWDERLPQSQQRALTGQIVAVYLARGTEYGLRKHLQICLGFDDTQATDHIKIEESPSGNFELRDQTVLGDNLLLGVQQDIYKFAVTITWPGGYQRLPRAFIETVIEANKPAHTSYTLNI